MNDNEWVPVATNGTAWRYVSRNGHALGTVVQSDKAIYRGRRLCCCAATFGNIGDVAEYVSSPCTCTEWFPL
jgi:hypothetical protein